MNAEMPAEMPAEMHSQLVVFERQQQLQQPRATNEEPREGADIILQSAEEPSLAATHHLPLSSVSGPIFLGGAQSNMGAADKTLKRTAEDLGIRQAAAGSPKRSLSGVQVYRPVWAAIHPQQDALQPSLDHRWQEAETTYQLHEPSSLDVEDGSTSTGLDVQSILAERKRVVDGAVELLVHWRGVPLSRATWELERDCPKFVGLIQEFRCKRHTPVVAAHSLDVTAAETELVAQLMKAVTQRDRARFCITAERETISIPAVCPQHPT